MKKGPKLEAFTVATRSFACSQVHQELNSRAAEMRSSFGLVTERANMNIDPFPVHSPRCSNVDLNYLQLFVSFSQEFVAVMYIMEAVEKCSQFAKPKKRSPPSPADRLLSNVEFLARQKELRLSSELLREVPRKWEKHGDFALLPAGSFVSELWSALGSADFC